MIEVVGEGGLLCTTEIGQEAHLIFIEGFILVVQGERGAFFLEREVYFIWCAFCLLGLVFFAPPVQMRASPWAQLLA